MPESAETVYYLVMALFSTITAFYFGNGTEVTEPVQPSFSEEATPATNFATADAPVSWGDDLVTNLSLTGQSSSDDDKDYGASGIPGGYNIFPPLLPQPNPRTPPRRPQRKSHVSTPGTVSPKTTPSPRRTPKRSGAPSAPESPSAGIRCSGFTKAGKRCTRTVKTGPALSQVNPDADIPRFCFQHTDEVLSSSGFYSKKTENDWVKFEDWIPDYLQPDTQTALRVEMDKPPSPSDVPGYIYALEIRYPNTPDKILLKVGRSVNLVERIDQQCGPKEQILRGWWPGIDANGKDASKETMLKGLVNAGEKGSYCHRLKRLVQLELADLAVNAPYLDPHFPKIRNSEFDTSSGADISGSSAPMCKVAAGNMPLMGDCSNCGRVHREIFVFTRVQRGCYVGKEWESIVKPVIEKWGAFVEAHV